MIPKRIHYCWFGRGDKPKLVQKCIKSWTKHCPDYEIIEWNEDNYDLSTAPLFVKQAIEAKKWAYATDYIRLKVVYDHGGVYLDTDVEVIKSMDSLLKDTAFFGFQNKCNVATGLGFGAEKGNALLLDLMKGYEGIPFIFEDGSMNATPCPLRDAPVFEQYGLKQDGSEQYLNGNIHIYPMEFFSPFDYRTGHMKKTKHTVSIHWFAASWFSEKQLRRRRIRWIRNGLLYVPMHLSKKVLGQERFERLKRWVRGKLRGT